MKPLVYGWLPGISPAEREALVNALRDAGRPDSTICVAGSEPFGALCQHGTTQNGLTVFIADFYGGTSCRRAAKLFANHNGRLAVARVVIRPDMGAVQIVLDSVSSSERIGRATYVVLQDGRLVAPFTESNTR